MHLDVVVLSRIQFALTLMFHYIFPPLTIGLGVLMVIIEAIWLKTKDISYKAMSLFWTKLFAINFALGVATGLVMEFQFGTNWATYSRYVGDIFGSALAAEAIFAFFLESGFLAVLVFGWDRVSPRMHFFSTCMVALGSIFSSIWITVANSWQQTPSGYHVVKSASGFYRAEVTDFWAMVFNPSMVHRVLHVWLGSFILGALFALSIASWYVLKNRHIVFAQRTIKISLIYAAVCSLLMLVSGHYQADAVARNQPAKLAAFEGHYKTGTGGTMLYAFGVPSDKDEEVKFGLGAPGMLSFLIYNNFTTPVRGLDQFKPEDRPPVFIPFQTYHLMVALGMAFIGFTLLGLVFLKLGILYEQKWLLWIYVFSSLGGYAANEAGWIAAEVGRQPWVVYGLLRTKDAVSKAVVSEQVISSMILFGVVYGFLFFVWVWIMNHRIQAGPPDAVALSEEKIEEQRRRDPFEMVASLLKSGPASLSDSWRSQAESVGVGQSQPGGESEPSIDNESKPSVDKEPN
jgi:cytochrome d ubiquinol oxidase subunit I